MLGYSEQPTGQRFYDLALSSQEKMDHKKRALKEVTFVLMPNPWEIAVRNVYILPTFYMISPTLTFHKPRAN